MGLFDNLKKKLRCASKSNVHNGLMDTLLSNECPPMIPIQWGFDAKNGERLIDVSVKRRKYIGYHNRFVFKK